MAVGRFARSLNTRPLRYLDNQDGSGRAEILASDLLRMELGQVPGWTTDPGLLPPESLLQAGVHRTG